MEAAALLRCSDKQLWRRIEHYVGQARTLERFDDVRVVGIDETSLRRSQSYITVVHDLVAKRLEEQRPGAERLRKQVERRTDELLRGRRSNLWR